MPEHLWSEFQSQSLSVLRQLPPDDERLKEIPPQFYAAFPLDDSSKTKGTAGSFGYPSETYKVCRAFDRVEVYQKMCAVFSEWGRIGELQYTALAACNNVFIIAGTQRSMTHLLFSTFNRRHLSTGNLVVVWNLIEP